MDLLSKRPGFRVVQGDILQDPARLLVCPVNCRPGVMGAGLALQFQKRFPALKQAHEYACRDQRLVIGNPLIFYEQPRPWMASPAPCHVVFFPTKENWKNDSRYDWIWMGLSTLYGRLGIFEPHNEHIEIAMPALGCGLGGPDWHIVGPMISVWATGLPERYRVTLYHTHGR